MVGSVVCSMAGSIADAWIQWRVQKLNHESSTPDAPHVSGDCRAVRRLRQRFRALRRIVDGFSERISTRDPQQHRRAVAGEEFPCDQDQRDGTELGLLAARRPDDCSSEIYRSDEPA